MIVNLTHDDILGISHVNAIGLRKRGSPRCTGVSTDSRTVKQGDLFLAVRGELFDGHNFLTKAVESGASGIVVDRRWAESNPVLLSSLDVPKLVVEDTVVALGDLARIHRRKFKIPVIVIGGSNGKTTTKDMVTSVLASRYSVLATEGNLNNHIGVPHTLFRLEKKHRIAVIEIGTNHFGELDYLCNIIEPTHALITTIGHEHLEFFGSLDGVAKAEGEAFQWLRTNRPRIGMGFINADDQQIARQAKGLKRVISYGFGKKATTVKGTLLGMDASACAEVGVKRRGKKSFSFKLGVPGEHNALNALAAATVGLTFNVPVTRIQDSLGAFKGSNKRMQFVELNGITILNDTYNSNPDSVTAALQTVGAAKVAGKKIAVLADMLELGVNAELEHRRIGEMVHKCGVEYLLTYGPLSNYTHQGAITKFKAHYDQKNILSEYLAELLTKGDIVLIKGSRGMKMEDVVTFLTERFQQAA